MRHGLEAEEFERTRSFLSKYTTLLVRSKSDELGYLVDSDFYGIGPYPEYVRAGLAKLTLEEVNRAIGRHLRADRLQMVLVGEQMEALRQEILAGAPSPIRYESPVSEETLAEDRVVERRALALDEAQTQVVSVDEMFA